MAEMLGLRAKCYIGQGEINIGIIGGRSRCANLRIISKDMGRAYAKMADLDFGCYIENQFKNNTEHSRFIKGTILDCLGSTEYQQLFTVIQYNDDYSLVGKGPWFYEIIDNVVTKMVSELKQFDEDEKGVSKKRCDYIIMHD